MHKISLAILTYNPFYGKYFPHIIQKNKKKILVLPCTFNQTKNPADKSPENVTVSDPHYQLLLRHITSIEHIVIFIGKASSGALSIIELLCTHLKAHKAKFFFILCDHNLNQKKQCLEKHRISKKRYLTFKDGHTRCKETFLLHGKILELASLY